MPETEEQNPKEKQKEETPKKKLDNQTLQEALDYARLHKIETLGYVALAIGLILLFFLPYHGGFLIGLVTGAFFSPEIISAFKGIRDFIDREAIIKSVILGVLLLAFFLKAPMILVGIAIAASLRLLFDRTI